MTNEQRYDKAFAKGPTTIVTGSGWHYEWPIWPPRERYTIDYTYMLEDDWSVFLRGRREE